jgi:hypothetical protein
VTRLGARAAPARGRGSRPAAAASPELFQHAPRIQPALREHLHVADARRAPGGIDRDPQPGRVGREQQLRQLRQLAGHRALRGRGAGRRHIGPRRHHGRQCVLRLVRIFRPAPREEAFEALVEQRLVVDRLGQRRGQHQADALAIGIAHQFQRARRVHGFRRRDADLGVA